MAFISDSSHAYRAIFYIFYFLFCYKLCCACLKIVFLHPHLGIVSLFASYLCCRVFQLFMLCKNKWVTAPPFCRWLKCITITLHYAIMETQYNLFQNGLFFLHFSIKLSTLYISYRNILCVRSLSKERAYHGELPNELGYTE